MKISGRYLFQAIQAFLETPDPLLWVCMDNPLGLKHSCNPNGSEYPKYSDYRKYTYVYVWFLR